MELRIGSIHVQTYHRTTRSTFSGYIIMEASSPLAAMQPPSFMPSWARNDLYTSHPHSHMSGASNFGPASFNFQDISMRRPSKPDYFAMKPVRGSSPTASLAADLSQNFHIDMRYVIANIYPAFAKMVQPSIANTAAVSLHFESFWDN